MFRLSKRLFLLNDPCTPAAGCVREIGLV
ncbi:rCG55708 [Rattus norvegicus]|uniref:RCG55708 n=1 Tax=Rattus norvegicus TaxID=10116 RepID=A6JLU1_RAT|nr:rCG55708 [Rattus norvegicus]